jgi:molecular chaperone DnaK
MNNSATEKVATESQALGSALYAAGAEGEANSADDGVEDAEVVEEQEEQKA